MTQTLRIRGGRPLTGRVQISGAKNAATKMMIASLLTSDPVVLSNVPSIEDVCITASICEAVGAKIERSGDTMTLTTPRIEQTALPQLSRGNRISILALAPLLNRGGQGRVERVGGDAIGPRPVNFHLDGLTAMGAVVTETDKGYTATAPDGLRGAIIDLPYPSVGATENIIFAAVLAKGRTLIRNAAIEPEINDIVMLLQRMGAIIEFGAHRTITVDGVERLHGASYRIVPDRLEAASYGLLAIATGGEIMVGGARQEQMVSFLNTIRRMGADYEVTEEGILFRRGTGPLKAIELETDTYPGFSTDWQQPTVVVLTQAKGLSVVHETVYEDRFGYTSTLIKMGADIGIFAKCLGELPCRFHHQSYRHSAVIKGGIELKGADSEIQDIRAGMAIVIAALVAEGESNLSQIHHLERGYEFFWDKLRAVGADFDLIDMPK